MDEPTSKHTKKQRSDLQAAAERLCPTFLDSLPVAVAICDLDGANFYVNKQMTVMTGHTVDELLRGVWWISPDDTDAAAIYAEALRTGTSGLNYKTRIVRKDNSQIWVSISWTPYLDGQGERIGLCTVFSDITDEILREEALATTTERFEAFGENASDMFVEWDKDGIVTYVSSAVSGLGYSPDEIVGKWVFGLVHPDDRETALGRHRKVFADRTPLRHEVRVHARDGSLRWLEAQVGVIVENGVATHVRGVYRDITARKNADNALAAANERYRVMAENSADMFWEMDLNGVFTYASPATRNLGYEPDEWLGHSLTEFLAPDEVPIFLSRLARGLGDPGPRLYEVRIKDKNGEEVWVEVMVNRWLENGEPVKLHGIARNITERKRSEAALRDAHVELGKAYMLQRQFLNSVTHEVRTPLTAVKGYVEMLMEGISGPVTDEQAELLAKVLTSSDRLLEIVDSVLQVARMKSGQIALYPSVCDPMKIIDGCILTVTPQAAVKGLNIVASNRCAGCSGAYDQEKLTMILTNLLSNAIKFTTKGAIEVFVSCTQDATEIVVADTGIGISDDAIGAIFDEFVQLDYPGKHKPVGFGIGLSLVAMMIDAIGAGLVVSSRQGVGSAFTLQVPVLKET